MSPLRRSSVTRNLVLAAALIAAMTVLIGLGTGWALAASDSGSTPTISSDKADYAPGDAVVLTGEGWQAGESVQIDVEDSEGKTWAHQVTVTADESGSVRDEFNLPEWFVATYSVTATGEVSGVATTTFTDGNVYVKNASTTPAGVAVQYKLEGWANAANCPVETTPTQSSTFTITGPEAVSVSPLSGNSVGANNKDSVRISFLGAPSGYGFDKWQTVAGAPAGNVGNDGAAQSTSTSFCLNVSASNISQTFVGFVKATLSAPKAKAGSDQTVNEGSTVALDGSGSTGATSYSWTQLTGPSVTLTGGSTASPSFTAPDGPATLTFRLTATNAAGSTTDDVQVTVNNVAPTVTLTGPTTATKYQTKTYTYSVTDPGDAAGEISIGESCGSGATYVNTAAANSFDCTFTAVGSSNVEVTANDGADIGSDSKNVTVSALAPTVGLSGSSSADEGSTKTFTYTVSGAPTTVTESCGASGTKIDTPDANSFDCTFGDGPGSSTVSVSATEDGATGSATKEVAIANLDPTIALSGPTAANEGDSKDYSYTASDPAGSADPLTVTIDCGANGSQVADGDSDPTTFRCSFPDGPAESVVEVSASDGDGGSDSDAKTVTIANVAPTVELSGPAAADEGQAKTYTYSVTDPGDTPSVSLDCGSAGTYVPGSDTGSSFKCLFADGSATSTVKVSAADGTATGSATKEVTIANLDPTIALSGPTAANEGDSKDYSYTASDPAGSADPLTVTIDCGANGSQVADGDSDPTTFRCSFPDGPAESVVEVSASDGDGGSDSDAKTVTIANVAPTVELSGPAAADEGQSKTYTYSVTDPGADTPAVSLDCGSAGTYVPGSDTGSSFECLFADGSATSTVKVSADDGTATGSATKEVAIANVAPSGSAGGPYSGVWGSPIAFSGSASDPAGSNDVLTYEWDFDYSGSFSADATGASPSHTYAIPGNYTAALRVSDEDGGTDSIRTASVGVGTRPTTLTYSGDSTKQYSDVATLTATLLDGSVGIPNKTITFTIGSQSTTATTDASGVASATLKITQANGSYSVKSSFAGDADYGSSSDSDPFTVAKENAGAYYTGDLFAQTSSATSSTATVVLSATIKDITALTGDPAYDADGGEIPFAKVSFVDGSGNPLSSGCSNLSVGLVSSSDPKVGTATCNWSASIGSQDSIQFTVGIKVDGRYTRYESTDDVVVTVSKPLGTNFITGGGYLLNQASAGLKAGGAGAKTNFGFNVKYNKSGTNLQGNINAIVRNGSRVYQIKGNSMSSLYVAPSAAPSPTKPAKATFNGKASIQDITNPLAPEAIDGNATLQVTMTDAGEPGSADTIGLTVWNKAGGLWFASKWDGTRTVEQLLGGGNLLVR
jgi:hypothetical protein